MENTVEALYTQNIIKYQVIGKFGTVPENNTTGKEKVKNRTL